MLRLSCECQWFMYWVWAESVESFACVWELRCADSHSFSVSVGIFNLGGRGRCWRGMIGDGLADDDVKLLEGAVGASG